MKFKSKWFGVRLLEIYPTEFAPGESCPPELQEAASIDGVVEKGESAQEKPAKPNAKRK